MSKREVFDVFHQFGRLAQISLKSAYGFVQYHTIGEGHAAMQSAQGIELGGRRIREYSPSISVCLSGIVPFRATFPGFFRLITL